MRAKARRTAAHQTMVCVPILDLAGLIARADAAEAERDAALEGQSILSEERIALRNDLDAALARAMPEPVTMATLHDVLARPRGNYLNLVGEYTYTLERGEGRWYSAHFGEYLVDEQMVGHTVSGPLPDLPTPTAAQETPDVR